MDDSASQQEYDAVVRQHGNPIRVLAESAILRYIGELTGDAEIRYHRINNITFPEMDGISEFEVVASVTISQIEGIRELWAEEKRKTPSLTAIAFARDHAQEVFSPEMEIGDP